MSEAVRGRGVAHGQDKIRGRRQVTNDAACHRGTASRQKKEKEKKQKKKKRKQNT